MKLPVNPTTKIHRIYIINETFNGVEKLNLCNIRKKVFRNEAGYFWSKFKLAEQFLAECVAKGFNAWIETIEQEVWVAENRIDRDRKGTDFINRTRWFKSIKTSRNANLGRVSHIESEEIQNINLRNANLGRTTSSMSSHSTPIRDKKGRFIKTKIAA